MLKPDEVKDPNINWQDLRFRQRSRVSEGSGNDHRFAIGLSVFIVVALLFPWYAYEVVAYSIERDTTRALNEFGVETQEQIDEANTESQMQRAAAMEYQQRQSNANAELQLKRRVASVRVIGVSTGGNLPTVLVALGSSNIYEAQSTLCLQAGVWLHKNVSGSRLRVQSYRGNRPLVDAGEISC